MKNLIGLVIFLLLTGFQAPFAVAWAAGAGQSQTNTLVHTQDAQGQAALKPIAQLQVGDKVLAKSEWKAQGQNLSYEPITDILVTPAQPRRLVDLVLADGQKISTTDGHPFNTPEGWRDAILLKKGGKLLLKGDGESDKTVEIASVTQRTEIETTYNLEVVNAHTFFVGETGCWCITGMGLTPLRFQMEPVITARAITTVQRNQRGELDVSRDTFRVKIMKIGLSGRMQLMMQTLSGKSMRDWTTTEGGEIHKTITGQVALAHLGGDK